MATIVTRDGQAFDTADTFIVMQDFEHFGREVDDEYGGWHADDRINYADCHGIVVNDVMHKAGYTV